MRTTYPFAWITALGVVIMMLSMSGFWGAVGLTESGSHVAADSLNDSASKYNPGSGLEGAAESSDDGDIVGLIISGSGAFFDAAVRVVLIPVELMSMGFPRWFAVPIGTSVSLLTFIGLVQATIGRVYR